MQELLKEAGLLGKLECFQLEAEKLAEVFLSCPLLYLPYISVLPGESQTRNCSSADSHPIPCWQGCGQVGTEFQVQNVVTLRDSQGGRGERSWTDQKDSKSCSCCSSCCSACSSQGWVIQNLFATKFNFAIISFCSGGLGHKVETIDQCSQVHAVHEGGFNLSYLPQYLFSEGGIWKY